MTRGPVSPAALTRGARRRRTRSRGVSGSRGLRSRPRARGARERSAAVGAEQAAPLVAAAAGRAGRAGLEPAAQARDLVLELGRRGRRTRRGLRLHLVERVDRLGRELALERAVVRLVELARRVV